MCNFSLLSDLLMLSGCCAGGEASGTVVEANPSVGRLPESVQYGQGGASNQADVSVHAAESHVEDFSGNGEGKIFRQIEFVDELKRCGTSLLLSQGFPLLGTVHRCYQ